MTKSAHPEFPPTPTPHHDPARPEFGYEPKMHGDDGMFMSALSALREAERTALWTAASIADDALLGILPGEYMVHAYRQRKAAERYASAVYAQVRAEVFPERVS